MSKVQKRNFYKLYFGILPLSFWTIVGLVCAVSAFQLLQQYAYHLTRGFDFEFSWIPIAVKLAISNLIWALLCPLLLLLARSLSNVKKLISTVLFTRLFFVIGITSVQNMLALWLYNFSYYLQSGYMRVFFGGNNRADLITGFFTSLIEGLVIIGLFMAVDYQKKLANRERDLAKARLDALKMQLHPHFIFNTLHSISSMMDIDVKRAQQMVTKVGDLLRSMLAHDEVEFVTLKQEIDFVRNYLELEQIRFQDRMKVTFDIDERLTESKIPSLILQPLVENCIKHGVAKSIGQSNIFVSALVQVNGSAKPWLKLEIRNTDDHELQATDEKGFGIGLKNVEKRLIQNYDEDYYCEFRKMGNQHYKSEIRIPLEI